MQTDKKLIERQSSKWSQGIESKEQELRGCLCVGEASYTGQFGQTDSCSPQVWLSEPAAEQTEIQLIPQIDNIICTSSKST